MGFEPMSPANETGEVNLPVLFRYVCQYTTLSVACQAPLEGAVASYRPRNFLITGSRPCSSFVNSSANSAVANSI